MRELFGSTDDAEFADSHPELCATARRAASAFIGAHHRANVEETTQLCQTATESEENWRSWPTVPFSGLGGAVYPPPTGGNRPIRVPSVSGALRS